MMTVKNLKELILEAIEAMLLEHCEDVGIGHERAFVLYVQATSNRQGILRKASDQDIPFVECISELIPETVATIETRIYGCGQNEDMAVEVCELAILALFTRAMEVLGDIELMKEDSTEKGQ